MNWSLLFARLRSPKTRWGRRCQWIVLALLVYTLAGFFLLPAIIRWQLVKRLPGLTHRQAAIQQVKLNPYALSLTIRGLSLTETNGEPFAGFDEFYANFQLSSLVRWAWTFRDIRLTHPAATVIRDPAGQFNFANLFASASAPQPQAPRKPTPLPAVIIQHLVVTNGHLSFADQTRPQPLRLEYGPVGFDLQDLTTRRNKDGRYSLAISTAGSGNFAWSGLVSLNPPQSSGKFSLEGMRLKTYSPYLAEFTQVEIANGVLDIGMEYRLNAEAHPLRLDVTNVAVKLDSLQVVAPGAGESLLTLNRVNIEGASASLAAREARVPRVTVRGGSALLRREKDGQLNWLKLLVTQTNAPPKRTAHESGAETAAAPWKGVLDVLDLEGLAVTVEDRVPETPAKLGLDDLRVQVKHVSNQSNAPVDATVAFKWHDGGTVQVEAAGTLLPPAGTAKLAIAHLTLPPLQPYVEQQARLVLNSGDLSVSGQARYAPRNPAGPLVQFAGDVSIARFAAMDTVTYHDLAKWDDLSVRGIQLALQTNALTVNEVKFQGLATSLVVSSNGQLGVQALLKEKPSPAGQVSAAAPAAFPIKVAAVVFEKCAFHAADQSLQPRFSASVEEFNGTIRDLTLPSLGKARVDIRGKVSALAPFEVTGSVTPDTKNPFVDMKLALKNDDLTPFSPYSEKYAGYPLNKGKLSFDLSYNIASRQLKAANIIAIDQLTFGARNQNTNATKLPVKLAVALLKDRNGRIDLDLPVSGSLDDPKFSIGALVWKAIMNILLKVAASPFSLLGALVGGGGEELQYVDFAPGAATLDDTQTNKLSKLTKALFERPALSLEINASVNPVADREALARQKLLDKIKSLRAQELAAHGKPVPSLGELELEPGEYERLLRKTYEAAFQAKPELALREAQRAAAVTNAPATPPAAVAAARPITELEKGAARLVNRPANAAATKTPPPATAASAASPPPRPKSESEQVRNEMEQRLMTTLPATDDDLRELMLQRAQTVQKFLLDTGKVTPGRLFLTAPKPVTPGTNGVARATFSLG